MFLRCSTNLLGHVLEGDLVLLYYNTLHVWLSINFTVDNHVFLFSCTPKGRPKYSMNIALSNPEAEGGRLILVLLSFLTYRTLNY